MTPATYKMVDLGGIDLAEINGTPVPGIYSKINSAYNTCRISILCNWKFAGIVIAPSHVLIEKYSDYEYLINDIISVKSDDTISVIGIVPSPTISSLSVTENGVYTPEEGVDGFSPVTVNVEPPEPVLVPLSASQNGSYSPGTGEDGFSSVSVAVPPVKVSDNIAINWDFTNPINTSGQTVYSGSVSAIDGWSTASAKMSIVTGGITVERISSSWGGLVQRLKPALADYFSRKTGTISLIIDGELYSGTFTLPWAQGGTSPIGIGGCTLRVYRQADGRFELTIDGTNIGAQLRVISAVKWEFGSQQTLATKVNDIWVVNQNMNVDNEKLKQYILHN